LPKKGCVSCSGFTRWSGWCSGRSRSVAKKSSIAKWFAFWPVDADTEAGDFLIPKKEGAVTDDHIQGELGEILVGKIPGRQTADEITLFKSLGVAVEDLVAATFVYNEAKSRGVGTEVELGGMRS